jgi:hypothetical protein
MRIELRTARYLDNVAKMLLRPQPEDVFKTIRRYLTDRCPECGQRVVGVMDDGTHTWVSSGLDASTGEGPSTYVIVGCEGYWIINPMLLGMAREQWQDWTTGDLNV